MTEAPPAELASATPEALLDAIVQLTHRIGNGMHAGAADLRAQRDLCRREVLRRISTHAE